MKKELAKLAASLATLSSLYITQTQQALSQTTTHTQTQAQTQEQAQTQQTFFLYTNPELFMGAVKAHESRGNYGLAYYLLKKNENNKSLISKNPFVRSFIQKKKEGILEKISLSESSFSVCIGDFRNYTAESGLPEGVRGTLIDYFVQKGVRVYDGSGSCDLTISGSINRFNISTNTNVRQKSIEYNAGTDRIPNPRYQAAVQAVQYWCSLKAQAEARASEKKVEGGLGAVGNILSSMYRGQTGDKEGALRDAFRGLGNAIKADTADKTENVDYYRQKCAEAERELRSQDPYIEERRTGHATIGIMQVTKVGTLELSVRASSGNEIIFSKKITKSVKDSDEATDGFAGYVSSDPLEIATDGEIQQALISYAVEELKEEMDKLGFSISLMQKIKRAKTASDKFKKASACGELMAIADKYGITMDLSFCDY